MTVCPPFPSPLFPTPLPHIQTLPLTHKTRAHTHTHTHAHIFIQTHTHKQTNKQTNKQARCGPVYLSPYLVESLCSLVGS